MVEEEEDSREAKGHGDVYAVERWRDCLERPWWTMVCDVKMSCAASMSFGWQTSGRPPQSESSRVAVSTRLSRGRLNADLRTYRVLGLQTLTPLMDMAH